MTELTGLGASYLSQNKIEEKFPLHFYVWNNNTEKLGEILQSKLFNCETCDPHGRTPLLLAVALGLIESVKVLLHYKCDAAASDKQGWNVTQEAVGNGDPELLSLIIQHREYQQFTHKSNGISEILELLEEADDFYVEMKWEFSSWIPLISKMCPNDSYKIWKSGAAVRVDTTLVGFEQMNWQRGNKSFIYKGGERSSDFYEIDHNEKSYWKESISVRDETITLPSLRPPASVLHSRLGTPNVTTILDHDEISFTRQKNFLGWGSDKIDTINGYEAKVFGVSGVELVTRTRTEHLTATDQARLAEEKQKATSKVPTVLSFLHQAETEVPINEAEVQSELTSNPYNLTIEEYFNPRSHSNKDVGKLRKMTYRSQKFSATIALSDTFPLSLQEQILPVINLMAHSSSHFAKLRDFITLQLPAGFPVKIEIPLFRVLNARITFNNLNGAEKCPDGVVLISDNQSAAGELEDDVSRCIIDKSVFDIHSNYRNLSMDTSFYERQTSTFTDTFRDEEDELLQLAIQQSLADSAIQGCDEALPICNDVITEEEILSLALRESVAGSQAVPELDSEEEQLRRVLELSTLESDTEAQRRRAEQEEFERIIALSMTEK